jgi:hypothetical protein
VREPRLSRRTTLGSALAAPLTLGACDIDPPPRADPSSSSTPEPPEDTELVAAVVAELVRARSVVEAATLAVPDLTARLTPLAEAHAAHLDVLAGAAPDAGPTPVDPPTLPPDGRRALVAVGRSEQRLLREVRRGCADAASGDLARVLASVAASTSQHAAALSADGPGGGATG